MFDQGGMITAYKQRCLVAVRNGYAQSGVNAMRKAIVGALAAALLLMASAPGPGLTREQALIQRVVGRMYQ